MSHHSGGPLQHPPMGSTPPQGQFPVQQPQPLGPGSRTSTLGPLTSHNPQGLDGGFPQGGPPEQSRPFDPSHNRSFSQQGNMQGPPLGQQQQQQQQPPPPQQQQQHQGPPPPQHIQQQHQQQQPPPPPPQQQQQFNARPPAQQTIPRYGNGGSISSSGPPQLGALSFQGNQPPTQPSPPQSNPPFQAPHDRSQSGGVNLGQSQPSGRTPPPFGNQPQQQQQQGPPPPGPSAPSKPSFGLPLNRLYERDGLAVPMVVYQCIQAVDLFGLGLEGIYRQSGSMTHIQKLKNMFDTGQCSLKKSIPQLLMYR